jgi:hypothetical protein
LRESVDDYFGESMYHRESDHHNSASHHHNSVSHHNCSYLRHLLVPSTPGAHSSCINCNVPWAVHETMVLCARDHNSEHLCKLFLPSELAYDISSEKLDMQGALHQRVVLFGADNHPVSHNHHRVDLCQLLMCS